MAPRDLSVALLGCGTVGSEVVRLLAERRDDFAARCGANLNLVGIAVRDLSAERPAHVPTELLTTDAEALVRRADLVIELIGGIEPARSLILAALASGASVVTGNKALLAAHGPELHEATAEADVDLYYEAAVAGAIPIVYTLRESLAGDHVETVMGIVNGTTNYILDNMTQAGVGYEEALAAAQELGYAEADPTADVEGHDAAAKLAIMAALAFHSRVALDDVPVQGISHITAEDIAEARESGHTIKLLATARRLGTEGISLRVAPTLVADSHPLASVGGAYNAVVTESEAAGRLMFYGQGAGGAPTASAVLSDVVAAAAHRVVGGLAPRELRYASLPVLGTDRERGVFSVALHASDESGVLSAVAGAFAEHGVSIRSVHQDDSTGEGSARVRIVVHETTRAALDDVVAALADHPKVKSVPRVMPVEG
ncbi:MAG: homoserine dehydrogenase [Bowdeniella nasicola]|nr:homoserine dehydrogenase [Bowdeniella nasicola]